MQLHVRYSAVALGCVIAMGLVSTAFAGGNQWNISKTHINPFSPGQMGAFYTIHVGVAATSVNGTTGATPTVVTEHVPVGSGLTVTAMTGSGWTCDIITVPAAPTCSSLAVIAPGAFFPDITLTVNVALNAPAMFINSVDVAGGGIAGVGTATDPTTTPVSLQSFDVQ